jgi:protein gp37
MGATSIEWTDRTWNPVTGCDKVSPGCAHCYADGVAKRFWATQYPALRVYGPNDTADGGVIRPREFGDVMTHHDRLLEPLSWRKPARVFVNSMSDLFHGDVPDAFIDRVFAVMALAPQHTFQVLTKRAERMRAYFTGRPDVRIGEALIDMGRNPLSVDVWPLPNVWLGVSVENQHFADERIPLLLQTPAAVRFISAEPLLESVNLHLTEGFCRACLQWTPGTITGHCFDDTASPCFAGEMGVGDGIYWVIVGGESGPDARPFDIAWARSIVQQCKAADVACFVKQIGAAPIDEGRGPYRVSRARMAAAGAAAVECQHGFDVCPKCDAGTMRLRDRKGGDMAEWPEDLRVREFPAVRA